MRRTTSKAIRSLQGLIKHPHEYDVLNWKRQPAYQSVFRVHFSVSLTNRTNYSPLCSVMKQSLRDPQKCTTSPTDFVTRKKILAERVRENSFFGFVVGVGLFKIIISILRGVRCPPSVQSFPGDVVSQPCIHHMCWPKNQDGKDQCHHD